MGCAACSDVWFSAGIVVATKTRARELCVCAIWYFYRIDKVGEGHLTRDSAYCLFYEAS